MNKAVANRRLWTGKMIEKTACYLLMEPVIEAMAASDHYQQIAY